MTSGVSYQATILADSPLAYYRLDEISGTVISDISGHARTGTTSGSPVYAVLGALSHESDTAMTFNGTDSWITAPAAAVGNYSLEAWIKTKVQRGGGFILDISPQQLGYESGRVKFGTGGNYLWSPSSSYGDDQYHHVVATYDGRLKRLYVDGNLVNSVLDTTSAITGSTTYIARYYGSSPYVFDGSLDEIAIYGKALSAAQVLAHYTASQSTSTPPPSSSPSPSPSSTPRPSPSPSPSPSSTPSTIPMKHVLTADYVDGVGTKLPPALLGPWLSWASTSWQAHLSVSAAGIKAMFYTNPNRMAPGDSMWTTVESSFAHDCSGARIKTSSYGEYLMDPSSSSLRDIWKSYIAYESGVKWDAIFEDNANDVYGASPLPCGYTAASWLAASQGENIFQVPVPIVYNGLQIAGQTGLNVSADVLGGMEEGCYSLNPTLTKAFDSYWTQRENVELTMAQQNKLFFCYGMDTAAASSAADSRLFTYASFLLSYTPSLSALWEYYTTPSGFHVMPESKLVALDPLVATPSMIDGLLQPTGVYGREYAHCYVAGSYVGPCAAVVNPARYDSHAYPYGSKYAHTLVLSGGGILDGGSISVSGPPPPSTLANLESVIVFQ